MDKNITEVRIPWADKIYRTTDVDVIEEIKKMISELELVPVDEKYVEKANKEAEGLDGDNSRSNKKRKFYV